MKPSRLLPLVLARLLLWTAVGLAAAGYLMWSVQLADTAACAAVVSAVLYARNSR